jgi:hypothetical protein
MDNQTHPSELSSHLKRLLDVSSSDFKDRPEFQFLEEASINKEFLLSSIPTTQQPSPLPLLLLHNVLSHIPGPWPAIPLIRCHAQLCRLLPVETKPGDSDWSWLLKATTDLVKQSYTSVGDFIGFGQGPAFYSTAPDNFITYDGLRKLVLGFQLPITSSTRRKPIVAIALPNGPAMAAACMAVMTYYTAAPINPAAGPDQFRADVMQAGAKLILTSREDYERLQLTDRWVAENNIQTIIFEWTRGDQIALRTIDGQLLQPPDKTPVPNEADNIGLILFTSGTSGTKKVVPLTIHSIVAGIVFVMDSWGLTSVDICLNMMPLYHV